MVAEIPQVTNLAAFSFKLSTVSWTPFSNKGIWEKQSRDKCTHACLRECTRATDLSDNCQQKFWFQILQSHFWNGLQLLWNVAQSFDQVMQLGWRALQRRCMDGAEQDETFTGSTNACVHTFLWYALQSFVSRSGSLCRMDFKRKRDGFSVWISSDTACCLRLILLI